MPDNIKKFEYPLGIADSNNAFYRNRKVMFMAITGQSLLDKGKYYYDTKAGTFINHGESKAQIIITLPLPNDLDDNQNHEWSDTDYLSAISGVLSTTGTSKTTDGDGRNNSEFVSDSMNLVMSITRGLGAFTDMAGTRKPSINPGYFQNYERSRLRSFSFNYTFIPKNRDEAKQICEIVRAFKQYSSPQKGFSEQTPDIAGASDKFTTKIKEAVTKIKENGKKIGEESLNGMISKGVDEAAWDLSNNFIQMSPFVWHIIIFNDMIKELSQIRTCACSNISVKYGNGNFDTFADGMPKVITMNLEFQEMDLQFSNKYAEQKLDIQSNDPNASVSVATPSPQSRTNIQGNGDIMSSDLAGSNKIYDMAPNADGKKTGVIDSMVFMDTLKDGAEQVKQVTSTVGGYVRQASSDISEVTGTVRQTVGDAVSDLKSAVDSVLGRIF